MAISTSHRFAAIVAALFTATAICVFFWPPLQAPEQQGYPDSKSYFAIASGHQDAAYYYYAGRVLHPLCARAIAAILGLSLPGGFRALSCLSLAVLFVAVAANQGELPVVPLLAMAVVVDAFRTYYIPDLSYAALCAVFFLTLRRNIWLALPLLFCLHLTRESTIILTLIVAVVMFRLHGAFSAAVLAVGLIGMTSTSALVARGLPNHHGMSTLIFDFLKLAYNVSANFMGIVLWTDTNAATTGCAPSWSMSVHVGAIRRLGVCHLQWWRPLATLVSLASAFGILPLLVWRARDKAAPRIDLKIAYWYGLVSLMAAPLIGGRVARYTLYAWPAFWLCGGELLKSLYGNKR